MEGIDELIVLRLNQVVQLHFVQGLENEGEGERVRYTPRIRNRSLLLSPLLSLPSPSLPPSPPRLPFRSCTWALLDIGVDTLPPSIIRQGDRMKYGIVILSYPSPFLSPSYFPFFPFRLRPFHTTFSSTALSTPCSGIWKSSSISDTEIQAVWEWRNPIRIEKWQRTRRISTNPQRG
jgi:hypothetical protein